MKFNDIVRVALTEAGLTQAKLGEMIGVKPNAISSTVTRPNITLAKFVTIMNILGYEIIVRKNDEEVVLTNE